MKKASEIPASNRLYRSATNRMIGGVAGGLGEYLNLDPTIVRIGFILLTLLHGTGLIIYVLMWILVPTKEQSVQNSNDTVKENIAEMKNKVSSFGHSLHFNKTTQPENSRFWWAVLIIALGFYFLFRNFGIFDSLEIGRFWPVILIIAGLMFLLRK